MLTICYNIKNSLVTGPSLTLFTWLISLKSVNTLCLLDVYINYVFVLFGFLYNNRYIVFLMFLINWWISNFGQRSFSLYIFFSSYSSFVIAISDCILLCISRGLMTNIFDDKTFWLWNKLAYFNILPIIIFLIATTYFSNKTFKLIWRFENNSFSK